MKCSKSAQIIFSQPSEVEARHSEIWIYMTVYRYIFSKISAFISDLLIHVKNIFNYGLCLFS